nr:hypothetical protein [Candidatus Acidoferrales bacterium]
MPRNIQRDRLGPDMMNSSEQTELRQRAQDAKEYLIAQVVEEARQENVALSDLECKMLYFTESVETLPDIYEVNDQFEQEYDDAEYEAKISSLLRNARKRVQKESPDGAQRWRQAERDLRKEDHYLGVMVAQSHQSTGDFWPIMKWAGITMVVVSAGLYLDLKGLIPNWIENMPPIAWKLSIGAVILIIVFAQTFSLGELKQIFKRRSRE